MKVYKLCISGGAGAGKTTALTQQMQYAASNDCRCLIVVETRELAEVCRRFMPPDTKEKVKIVGLGDAIFMASVESLHKSFDAVFIDVKRPDELIDIIDRRIKAYRLEDSFHIVFTKSTDTPE